MKKLVIALSLIVALFAIFFVFIPAFQGTLQINPVIDLGVFQIRWYGLILAAAILTGYFWSRRNAWRFGLSEHAVDDYAFWLVIAGVLGARIYHVIFNYDYYLRNLSEVYKIWHGGISIYGAVLGGIVYTYFYAKNKAYTFYQLFDLVALGLPLAQAIGRFGNFVNQEAYGTVTDLPWKMYVATDQQYHHPTFLYEGLLNLVIFFVLQKLVGKTKSGIIGWTYLGLYSLGRLFIEVIRIDSFFVYGFRVDQLVAFLLVITSGLVILSKQREVIK